MPPLETLYIYYLHGRARYCENNFGPEFVGNWEEDDCSFLFLNKLSIKIIKSWNNGGIWYTFFGKNMEKYVDG